VEKERVDLDLP